MKLIEEVFQSLNSTDKRLQKLRVILLMPKCSVSAVGNPVEFLVQENGGKPSIYLLGIQKYTL